MNQIKLSFTAAINKNLNINILQDVLGRTVHRAAVLDKEIANQLQMVAEDEISECKSFIGKTMCTFDFYEGNTLFIC